MVFYSINDDLNLNNICKLISSFWKSLDLSLKLVIEGAVLLILWGLVRTIFPPKVVKQALNIPQKDDYEILNIETNIDFSNISDHTYSSINSEIANISQRITTNDQMIKILGDGLLKLSVFSKNKREKIISKKLALEQYNHTLRNNMSVLSDIRNKTKQILDIRNADIGDEIRFNNYIWLVLDRKDAKLLLLCKSIEDFTWNRWKSTNGWEKSSLKYACDSLYSKFSDFEKSLVSKNRIVTCNSGVSVDTFMFVFSETEIIQLDNYYKHLEKSYAQSITLKYCSSKFLEFKKNWKKATWSERATHQLENLIYDGYESYGGRMDRRFNGTEFVKGWWLRPEEDNKYVLIHEDGILTPHREMVGGLRPAMWIHIL